MKKLLLLIAVALLAVQVAQASTCDDYYFNFIGGNCTEFSTRVSADSLNLEMSDFNMPISTNLALSAYPSITYTGGGANIIHTIWDGYIATPYQWNMICTETGHYTINLTITETMGGNGLTCQKTISNLYLVAPEPYTVPNIEADIPNIPSLEIGESYRFEVNISNTGNGSSYDLNITATSIGTGTSISPTQYTIGTLTAENYTLVNFTIAAESSANDRVQIKYQDSVQTTATTLTTSNSFAIGNKPQVVTNSIDYKSGSTQMITTETESIPITFLTSSANCDEGICIVDSDAGDNQSSIYLHINSTENNLVFSYDKELLNITTTSSWTGVANINIYANDSSNLSAEKSITFYVEDGNLDFCDGEDNDGDTLVDEEVTCTATSISGGSQETNEPVGETSEEQGIYDIRAAILHPNREKYYVNEDIYMDAKIAGTDIDYKWDVGDGTIKRGREIRHTYNETGEYRILLTVSNGNILDTQAKNIKIIDCAENNECLGGEICCNNICRDPYCTEDSQCSGQATEFTESFSCLISENACQNSCSYTECTIACESDSDCPDKDSTTLGYCNDKNTCQSECIYTTIKNKIIINEPMPEDTYPDTNIHVNFETDFEGRCSFNINEENTRIIHGTVNGEQSFNIDAVWGENTLTIQCIDDINELEHTESVDFIVGGEELEPEYMKNIAAEATREHIVDEEKNLLPTQDTVESIYDETNRRRKIETKKSLGTRNEEGSEIIVFVKNNRLALARNIKITEKIPKEVTESATQIISTTPFEIIEEDPVIRFTIPELVPGKEVKIIYKVPNIVSEDELELIISEIELDEDVEEEREAFIARQEETQENIVIEQTKKVDENKTSYENKIRPEKAMTDVDVYLSIPKCMAEKINEMKFSDENFEIIAEDPLIVWHFAEVNSNIDIEYSLEGLVEEDCENQAAIVAVAKIIEDRYVNDDRWLKILIPLLLIPILAGGILLIYHFNPKNHIKNYYVASFNPIGAVSVPPSTPNNDTAPLFPSIDPIIEPPELPQEEQEKSDKPYPYDDRPVNNYPKP